MISLNILRLPGEGWFSGCPALASPDTLEKQTPRVPQWSGHTRAFLQTPTEGPGGWALLLAEATFPTASTSFLFPVLALALDSVRSFTVYSVCSIPSPRGMVERKGAKGLESLGLYLKLRFPLFFRCILLKLFSLSEAHFLHQFMCFGLRVIKMQLKVVGIIEICFSHKSRCPEVARGVSGYYIGSPFVIVLPFSSCL